MLMLAIVVLLLLHTPPVVRSFKAVVAPGHTDSIPVMLNGKGLTVIAEWVLQPVAVAVKVMVEVPGAVPTTMPEDEPMVAADVLLLLHMPLPPVPPPAGSLNAVVDPAHSAISPLMAGGSIFTVTVVAIVQPVPIE